MINDVLKWAGRTILIAVFWVFALSVTVSGRPLFNYANETLVQNEIVRYIDTQLGELWAKISETARVTYNQLGEPKDKA